MRIGLVLLLLVLMAACSPASPTTVPPTVNSAETALPQADVTEISVTPSPTPTEAPELPLGTVIVADAPIGFDDLAVGAVEIAVNGVLAAQANTPPRARFAPSAQGGTARQLTLILEVAATANVADQGVLTLTMSLPASASGAQSLIKGNAPAGQFGVVATLSGVESTVITLADIATYAVQGDLRILQNNTAFTAAFDVTITSSVNEAAFQVTGRLNQLPFQASP